MNVAEAKLILSAHRPGREAADDSDVLVALELARRDPALGEWWKQQQAFHSAMKRGFNEIPVPDGLRDRISPGSKVVPFPWWRRPTLWAAAAAVALLVGIFALQRKGESTTSFDTFRSRMVRTVLRQYRMDIQTNDMAGIRQFLGTNNAPADYVLPINLARLTPLGAGVLSWQGTHVSMVCLNSGAEGTLFLFVADRSSVKQASGMTPQYARVKKLTTVSWTEGEKVYVLAGEVPQESLARYF